MPMPTATETSQRRRPRIGLSLPARVEYKVTTDEGWEEITRLNDVSPLGAGFYLTRPVKSGRLLLLTLPMPRQLRVYDFLEPQYRVFGLVRSCKPSAISNGQETYLVGVAFTGKHPPLSYTVDPAKLYEIVQAQDDGLWHLTEAQARPDESAMPQAQRRHSRYSIPMPVKIEALRGDGTVKLGETTVTDNISIGGASVLSTVLAEIGSIVRLTSEQYNVAIRSIVRGKHQGADGIGRLHLEFMDRYFPLEGIE
jgi:hypothetical protein